MNFDGAEAGGDSDDSCGLLSLGKSIFINSDIPTVH